MAFLTNKSTGKKFPLKDYKRHGSPPNISHSKNLLTVSEFNKILADRQIRTKDLATDKEIEDGEAKAISLNPEHEDHDIIFVRKDSPIELSQKKYKDNPDLQVKELEVIKKYDEEHKDEE